MECSLSRPKARAVPDEAKKLSLTVLVISLPLLYVVFLPFPLSSLLQDTVFWFLVSNSIILVIAADSCVFSSSHACDFYDEFIKHSRTRQVVELSSLPFSTEPPLMKTADGINDDDCEEAENGELIEGAPPKKIDDHENSVNKRPTPLINKSASTKFDRETLTVDRQTLPFRRSATEKKIEYEVREDDDEEEEEDTQADEYSSMSIEELNERVEEFIRRFNREMRLQNE